MTWLHIFLIEVVDIYKGLLYDKAWMVSITKRILEYMIK